MTKPIRLNVGHSGGIDSSVAAYLLKEKKFQVEGLYLQLIDECKNSSLAVEKTVHSYPNSIQKVYDIAQKLSIPFHLIDFRTEFYEIIIKEFIEQYEAGLTPNPCIFCNEKVKFKLLYNFALQNDFDYIATGHYAWIDDIEGQGRRLLKRGIDKKKDQSYFLYRINEFILSKCIFPLGIFRKEDIFKIAQEKNLSDSFRKESQEICFVSGNNYRNLFDKNKGINNGEGYFLDSSGNILGRHKGISSYTIGQRKGLGLALNSRKYVIKINKDDNTVIIGDEAELYQKEFTVAKIKYIFHEPIKEPVKLLVQIRYNAAPSLATICPYSEDKIKIIFDKAQRAITPGQSAVFYDEDIVVGGGIVE